MWLEAVLVGILIGLLRGGRLNQLDHLYLKGFLWILLGLILQMIPFFLHFQWITEHAVYFTAGGLGVAIVVILFNFKRPGMPLVALGAGLQFLVLGFNQWRMPIRLMSETSARFVQMSLAIESGEIANYILFSDVSHWSKYLGKIFILPDFYPVTMALGIPDILIGVGVAWFIQELMVSYKSYGRSRYYSRKKRY